jgi:hypothetical protein
MNYKVSDLLVSASFKIPVHHSFLQLLTPKTVHKKKVSLIFRHPIHSHLYSVPSTLHVDYSAFCITIFCLLVNLYTSFSKHNLFFLLHSTMPLLLLYGFSWFRCYTPSCHYNKRVLCDISIKERDFINVYLSFDLFLLPSDRIWDLGHPTCYLSKSVRRVHPRVGGRCR